MTDEIVKHEAGALVADQPTTVMNVIMAMAKDPRVDVDKLRDLLAMQERLEARAAKTEFHRAMKACQDELQRHPIVRDAKNESNKSRYARLETVNRVAGPIIAKHGFALSFGSSEPRDPKALRVKCTIMHEAGHSEVEEIEGALDMTGPNGNANKTAIQGLGSAASYLRRYLTLMIFNLVLVNEDNDGQKGAFVTDAQAQAIAGLLAQCSTNPKEAPAIEKGFLDYMGAKAIGEIHALDFQKAVTILESKKRKMAEVPEVAVLPDAVELTKGSRRRCKGKVHEVVATDEGHKWQEVK